MFTKIGNYLVKKVRTLYSLSYIKFHWIDCSDGFDFENCEFKKAIRKALKRKPKAPFFSIRGGSMQDFSYSNIVHHYKYFYIFTAYFLQINYTKKEIYANL